MREIKNFMAHLKQHGVSRNNRFKITIPLPKSVDAIVNPADTSDPYSVANILKTGLKTVSILSGGDSEAHRGLQIMCASTQLPGYNMDTVDVKQNGPSFKVVTGTSQSEINMKFLISADCLEKRTLDIWRNSIFDETTRKSAYYEEYITDIQIDVLDVRDRTVYSIILEDAYPIVFSPIEMAKQASDEVLAYQCAFTYRTVSEPDKKTSLFEGTVIGDVIEDVKNGDWQSALATGREQVVQLSSGNYSGIAGDMYGMISDTAKSVSGLNVSESNDILSKFIPSIQDNSGISSDDKSGLVGMVKNLIK